MSRRKILYVTANPTKDLEIDVEYRYIKAEMERGSHRDAYEFLPAQFAVTIGELLRAVNDKPYLIHFSGHGRKQGSVIVDEDNSSLLLPLSELKSLLMPLQGDTRIVFFNSCSSSDQAREISELGMYVIGYNYKIGDKAAIDFAKGFYNGLGEGKSLRGAFLDGLIQLGTLSQGTKRGLGTEEDKNSEIEIWKDGQKQNKEDLDDTPPLLPEVPDLIPRLLTTPPFISDYFIGRESDLKVIESQFQKQNKQLFLMNGEGGIGKTTLSAQYWYRHEKFYQHLAWIFADMGVGNALLVLANQLKISFEPKAKFEEQLETVLLALNKLNAPCLLVLDNANDANDLEKHYIQLKKLPNFHILLTTRVNELADAPVHKVLPLDETDAIALFKYHYASFNNSEEDLLKSILHAVGYNTLVIELLAKNLAVQNKFNKAAYTLINLLHDLREKGLLEIQSRAVNVTYQSDILRQAKPEDIIRAMYDLTGLNDSEKYLLSNFAVLPAENITYDTFHDLLKPEKGIDFEEALSRLQQKGWIEYTDSFRVSPVVQMVVRDKNGSSLLMDCKVLIDRLTEKLHPDNIHEGNYKYSSICNRYAESVIALLKEPNYSLALIYERIGNFYTSIGSLEKAFVNFYQFNIAAKKLCDLYPDEPWNRNLWAVSFEKLGSTYSALGQLGEALFCFERCSELIEQLIESYPYRLELKSSLSVSFAKLGETHKALDNLKQALTYFIDFNTLVKQLHDTYPKDAGFKNSLAVSYQYLGEVYSLMEEFEQALIRFKKYNFLNEQLHKEFPDNVKFKNGLAISFAKLGDTYKMLGNLGQALISFERSSDLEEQLHKEFPANVEFRNGLAMSYERLGTTHSILNNLEKALTYFSKCLDLGKQLHDCYPNNVLYKNGLAVIYAVLGEFYRDKKKDTNEALTHFHEAEKLWLALTQQAPKYVLFQDYLDKLQGSLREIK